MIHTSSEESLKNHKLIIICPKRFGMVKLIIKSPESAGPLLGGSGDKIQMMEHLMNLSSFLRFVKIIGEMDLSLS